MPRGRNVAIIANPAELVAAAQPAPPPRGRGRPRRNQAPAQHENAHQGEPGFAPPAQPGNAQPAPQAAPIDAAVIMDILTELRMRMTAQETVAAHFASGQHNPPGAHQPPGVVAAPRPLAEPQLLPLAARPEMTERFIRMNCPPFEGSSDPTKAKGWLSDATTRMDLLSLNDAERVKSAAFLMRDNART